MRNQRETIRRMVDYLNNEEKDGGYWLPNIQRRFVWHEDQIERLFDSIMREYPISTLLAWKTRSFIRHRKFIDHYHSDLNLADFYVPEHEGVKSLILDGQQRLQSLFIGLKGSYNRRELFFDVLSGDLVAPEDVRYKFRFLAPERAVFPWVRFKDIVFSNEIPNRLADAIIARSDDALEAAQKVRVVENVWKAAQMFANNETLTYQELDSVDNPGAYTEDDIVEIFIRANAGGTRLGKSDLLFSLLTSSWDDADERMEELIDDLNRTGYDFSRDFILKTCLSLLKKGARYDVRKFRDGNTKESIIEQWDAIAAAIRDVRDFLYGKTFVRTDRAMPSYLTLIPVIYFRYHYPDQWRNVQGLDGYILRTLITGAFSGTPDTLIDKCTRLIDQDEDFIVPHLFGEIRADGRNLDITGETILGIQYGSRFIHLLFNLWYRDFNYLPSYQNNLPQVDHIFPQSLLKSIKGINPETGTRNLLRYKQSFRDQIANCMLLTAKENGAGGKGNTPPDEWFAGKPEEYLQMHLIPDDPELWKLENFERFLECRKDLVLEKFHYMLQHDDA